MAMHSLQISRNARNRLVNSAWLPLALLSSTSTHRDENNNGTEEGDNELLTLLYPLSLTLRQLSADNVEMGALAALLLLDVNALNEEVI